MKIDKKAINYYYSFFEVSKELNQKQFYEFNMAIYKVMFFEEHIDNITFTDTMLTILWKSVKHSVMASVKGFCDKKSIPYDDVFTPLANPLTNKQEGQEKGQEQEKEQYKGEVQVCNEFTFSLSKQRLLASTSKEYQSKLEEYITNSGKPMSYEDFYNQCEMKPYKYKNFKMAYDKWNSNSTAKQPIKSFKQQDAEKTEDALDAFLNARANGFDLRNISSDDVQDCEVIEG